MSQAHETPSKLLADVIRALVDAPQAVRVREHRRYDETHLTIDVSPADRGKIIGKGGTTVQSLRVLFGRIAAAKGHGQKIFIHLAEGPGRQAA